MAQQRAVMNKAFEALYSIQTPGTIIDIPWRWKREKYIQDSVASNQKDEDS